MCIRYYRSFVIRMGNIMEKTYNTKGKEAILNFAKESKSMSFSAGDVIEYLENNGISMNQATVYRNLEKMTDAGTLIRTKNSSDNSSHYRYIEPEDHCSEHLHLQCKVCGKIIHLNGMYMSRFYKHIEELGFTLEHDESVILGICRECQ